MGGIASKENGKKGGRPKGKKSQTTLEREAVEAAVKQRILQAADSILNSQLSLGRGQSFLYRIDKTEVTGPKGGVSYKNEKPLMVTDPDEIAEYLNGDYDSPEQGESYYYITTKEPSNLAIDSMFNRTFGKARESVDVTSGGEALTSGSPSMDIQKIAAGVAEELRKRKLARP